MVWQMSEQLVRDADQHRAHVLLLAR